MSQTLGKIRLKYKEADVDYWLLKGKFDMFLYVLKQTYDFKLIATCLGDLLKPFDMDDETNTVYVSNIFKTAMKSDSLTSELIHKLMYALLEADVPVESIRWVERNLLHRR